MQGISQQIGKEVYKTWQGILNHGAHVQNAEKAAKCSAMVKDVCLTYVYIEKQLGYSAV